MAGIRILTPVSSKQAEILTPAALDFVATLHRSFNARRKQLLSNREARQRELDAGKFPDFLPETERVRKDVSWKGAAPAPGLVDRRVEITGPVSPAKMVINASNSGAPCFMADFEDSHSPTWEGNLDGQLNMRDLLRRTLTYSQPDGKYYKLREDGKVATLIVRPRGWHMEEAHMLVDGERVSASLFDFGLYFFHNAKQAIAIGAGPYFYLPKMESHLEARLWNDVFNMAQDYVGLPRGTIRATVLIETILAAFEMEEIIFELRDQSSGLNCGRWDFIFSFIKKLRNHPQFVLPDRSNVTMSAPFMAAYVRLLIQTCHKRGVHAMGGMAAFIPIKGDKAANDAAMAKVEADKQSEVLSGADGSWVAHPDLVKLAMAVFDKHMPGPNQLHIRREDVVVTAADLLNPKVQGAITEKGVRDNIDVGLQYAEAWLRGVGCVPIHNMMEDLATVEISRSQLWQWVRHGVRTAGGHTITPEYVNALLEEDVAKKRAAMGEQKYSRSKFDLAKRLIATTIQGGAYSDFLSLTLYEHIVSAGPAKL